MYVCVFVHHRNYGTDLLDTLLERNSRYRKYIKEQSFLSIIFGQSSKLKTAYIHNKVLHCNIQHPVCKISNTLLYITVGTSSFMSS